MKKAVISEAFLQQVEALQMLIKNNVAGMFGGNRKSKNYGSSCEFADYRDYMQGDDTTKIDWKAYARFDKLYQKLYLDERQMHTRIYIDGSRSMQYGDNKKAEQALKLTAALAYIAVADMDKVSVYVIRGKELEEVFTGIVGKEAFFREVGKLDEIEFYGDSEISNAILPTKVGYGDGMSVLISDFLTDDNYERADLSTGNECLRRTGGRAVFDIFIRRIRRVVDFGVRVRNQTNGKIQYVVNDGYLRGKLTHFHNRRAVNDRLRRFV